MHINKKASIKYLLFLGIVILSMWQFGTGSYIYMKAQLAQHLLNNAWNKTVDSKNNIKPWPWADTYPIARLTFEKFKKELIVLAGGTGHTMAFGPGHVSATPLPGYNGNSVIAGHRDTHFKLLKDIKLGDKIKLQTKNTNLKYTVTDIFIVDQGQTQIMKNFGIEALTLITCYPFNSLQSSSRLRYVVQAQKM